MKKIFGYKNFTYLAIMILHIFENFTTDNKILVRIASS